MKNGDKNFILDIVNGIKDNSIDNNVLNQSPNKINDWNKIKYNENSKIEEQGNRLVDTKTKSPSLSNNIDKKQILGNKYVINNNSSPVKNITNKLDRKSVV